MWRVIKPSESNLRVWQVGLLVLLLTGWQLISRDLQFAFFLGEPIKVAGRVWSWFMPFGFGASLLFPDGLPGHADIYLHLGTTLLETVLAFGIGTVLGLACGLWLALAPTASAILDPQAGVGRPDEPSSADVRVGGGPGLSRRHQVGR